MSTPHNVLPFTARPDESARADPTGATRVTGTRAVYTVAEVADLLDLSLGGTYQLCRNGEIPAIKLGNRWVIPKRRFHDWLDNLGATETETR